MVVPQEIPDTQVKSTGTARKRRLRRKKLQAARATQQNSHKDNNINFKSPVKVTVNIVPNDIILNQVNNHTLENIKTDALKQPSIEIDSQEINKMSSKEMPVKSRDEVKAAREAKKLAKQKAKNKVDAQDDIKTGIAVQQSEIKAKTEEKLGEVKTSVESNLKVETKPKSTPAKSNNNKPKSLNKSPNSKDEVDKAVIKTENIDEATSGISKEQVKSERTANKGEKQAQKKISNENLGATKEKDLTVEDVVNTLKDICNVAKEVESVTARVEAIDLHVKKAEVTTEGKSKAELKAERRAKQEAQRAAKEAALTQKVAKPKEPSETAKPKEDKQPSKPKLLEKSKSKNQLTHRISWFQHLYTDHDREALKNIPINSNLHPAVIKLGIQLASHVVTGANASCIALLDALKKMVRDYSLPARTEFGRGVGSQLNAAMRHLAALRPPTAAMVNAVTHFRRHLTHLPNNVDEFDAKKKLHEEIDRYIREQIDMAGEAISITVRSKISDGDNILTYGCSSLIERILREAYASGMKFRTIVAGSRVATASDMLRRLVAAGLPTVYVDISALSYVMLQVNKVVMGVESVLANGAAVCAAGGAQVALLARARNVPLLVACETHKFAERVQIDAFLYNEIGDPDILIDKTDKNSPLKDWRSNPNLTLLNIMYDVTPPSLITAVVTELGILPCTSAPVVLRCKLSEYGM